MNFISAGNQKAAVALADQILEGTLHPGAKLVVMGADGDKDDEVTVLMSDDDDGDDDDD